MDENVIADLKQFIAGAITQQTSDLRIDVHGIHQDIRGIHHDIQKLDTRVGALEMQVKDHGQRIVRLEQRTA
jgi:predicted  nucleic acid-binding Zn-ribbon protein